MTSIISAAVKFPGFRFIPQFSPALEQQFLTTKMIHLHQFIGQHAATGTALDKPYKKMQWEDLDGNTIHAQHFKRYGEDGHQRAYFTGNQNIPSFIRLGFIPSIESLPEVQALKSKEGHFDWNFTLNTYTGRSLLPFPIDTPSNGDVTAIFTLLSEAKMELQKGNVSASVQLTPGSLAVLSGDSQLRWQHRIVSQEEKSKIDDSVHRISLVFGCKFHPEQIEKEEISTSMQAYMALHAIGIL